MSFPPHPRTDDETRTELLRLMSASGYPGVYVLGCFARYVTVHAQQVRALNLIDALVRSGRISRYSRVAVVGGGIAGLTAAAAAAARGAGHVSVFEQLENTMRLQRVSEQRHLDPHIYDWPDGARDGGAALPLMGWRADRAAEVVKQLEERWREVRQAVGDRLAEPRCGCRTVRVTSTREGPAVQVNGEAAEGFDLVVLAVGFGRDAKLGTHGYWTDSEIDGLDVEPGGTWLVSGYGDGALTDLMRLCVLDFRHRTVLEAVDEAAREEAGDLLLRAEREHASPEELAEAYRSAAAGIGSALDGTLKKRGLGQVWLNCSRRQLFTPRSSILNRLITAYLLDRGRFGIVEGKIEGLEEIEGRRYRISFEGGPAEPMEVDHVIVRHGPDRALEQGFPEIWAACRGVREEWGSARQWDDWTREPLYDPRDFALPPHPNPPLRVDFGPRIGCTVVTGSRTPPGTSQGQRVQRALELFARRSAGQQMGRTIDTRPEQITAADALSSPAAYERTVRAMCDSDVVVFDITGFESAVMLFLGVRAAVRRGITVTVTQDAPGKASLPFNLAALNPIRIDGTDDANRIARALEAGYAALKSQPDTYLDLPVFDAVRHLGEDHGPLEPHEQILILRWFDAQYGSFVHNLVDSLLNVEYGDETAIVTTLDSQSPQLVGQRLYAAIRRTRLCIADWTGWRPNVFFEMGVRLAVSPTDPVCILCEARPPGWDDETSEWPTPPDPSSARLLEDFFAPTRFDFTDDSRLRARIADPGGRAEGAKLSPGRTYAVVSESVERREEPGGRPVEELLAARATALAGPPGPEEGGVPVLFAETLAEQARHAAVESLLAAWYYLDGRHALLARWRKGELPADDPGLAALVRVGQQLSARLRNVRGAEYDALARTVRATLAEIELREEAPRG